MHLLQLLRSVFNLMCVYMYIENDNGSHTLDRGLEINVLFHFQAVHKRERETNDEWGSLSSAVVEDF